VSAEESGQRLDRLLGGLPQVVSREMAQRLIAAGEVRLNAGATRPAARVRCNDLVEFRIPPPEASPLAAQPAPLDVLYEDAALIVLNKPAGVAVHPGPGHAAQTLVNHLLAHCPDLAGVGGTRRPGIVHRLDKDTSGVLVVAKHDRAHQGLAAQFKAHSIQRRYLAIVVGAPPRAQGTIDLPLARDPRNRFKRGVRDDGKRAVTHWRVLQRRPPFALLELRLETGRTHQIRAHLAAAGWPVLGDPLYGGRRHRGLRLDPALEAHVERFARQALHAAELGFRHPQSGAELLFTAPMPRDMQALWDAIGATAPTAGAAVAP
ncbi:MAG TPA: RluA family pseudouridine synthase, partial [bacterium]